MDIWDFLFGSDKEEQTASQQLEKLYEMINEQSKNVKMLKDFTPYTNKMDVVRYNQFLFDDLTEKGWKIDLLTGKFTKVLS